MWKESPECVKLLIENKCDIDLVDCAGKSAFHYACESGNELICKILMDFSK